MKLAQLYNRATIFISLGILLCGGVVYYASITRILNQELDRDLSEEISELKTYIAEKQAFPHAHDSDEDQISFTPIKGEIIERRFVDTTFVDKANSENEDGRAVIDVVTLKGTRYKAVIVEPKEEIVHLVQLIGLITLLLGLLLVTIILFTTRIVLSKLWQPFYDIMAQARTFSLSGTKPIQKINSIKADEFRELEATFQGMAHRATTDYQSLKTFTENASHEMMTPIAVITSKLDNLIQDEDLTAKHFDQLQDLYNAARKISRLNQSLLLLVKIDNGIINDSSSVDLQALLVQKLRQFSEIAQDKGIKIESQLLPKTIEASPYLMEILLDNLLSNSIRHNVPGGEIRVKLDEHELIFQNSAKTEGLDPCKIFQRFQKGIDSEGTGLGLTIAQNICRSYDWELLYSFNESLHIFTVDFQQS